MSHNRKLIKFFYQFSKFRDDVTKFVHKLNQVKFSLLRMHEKIMLQYANTFSVIFIFSLAEISSSQSELPTSFCKKSIVHCFLDLIESKRRNKTHCNSIKKFRHIKKFKRSSISTHSDKHIDFDIGVCFERWFLYVFMKSNLKTLNDYKLYCLSWLYFVMASHSFWNYLFLVIVMFSITCCVDRPNCDFNNNLIEPPGTGNLPLTQEWFIWGQLFSYCLQVR